jgi:hypothetical protein
MVVIILTPDFADSGGQSARAVPFPRALKQRSLAISMQCLGVCCMIAMQARHAAQTIAVNQRR